MTQREGEFSDGSLKRQVITWLARTIEPYNVS